MTDYQAFQRVGGSPHVVKSSSGSILGIQRERRGGDMAAMMSSDGSVVDDVPAVLRRMRVRMQLKTWKVLLSSTHNPL